MNQTIEIGARVQFHNGRTTYILDRIDADGTAFISKVLKNGQTLRMCNPIHVCDIKPLGARVTPKDKFNRTAHEKGETVFQVGERAIMTILGDLWVTVKEIRADGSIVAAFDDGEQVRFRPRLFMGVWTWWTSDHYHLRPNDGHFQPYDN